MSAPEAFARLPLTYDECRARFHRAADRAGVNIASHPIAARGPAGQWLSIDVTEVGEPHAETVLLVLSGVHGVEGFVGSELQCDLLSRLATTALPSDVGVVLVHAVNPWGMAWSRRQNESNVDLNRNWRRSEIEPIHNDAYDEIHSIACPAVTTMPDVDDLLATATEVVKRRGLDWVRRAITTGQYRHSDGLHYGGDETEQSNRVLEEIVGDRIDQRERVLVIDLHTGHGPHGEVTLLSDQSPDSAQHRFFCHHFPDVRVEATVGDPTATTGLKSGQIANGIRARFPAGRCWSASAEIGTASDMEQLAATYRSHWVHLHGDHDDPEHRAAVDAYRSCFTPDDREWERVAVSRGQRLLDAALVAVCHFDDTDEPGEP